MMQLTIRTPDHFKGKFKQTKVIVMFWDHYWEYKNKAKTSGYDSEMLPNSASLPHEPFYKINYHCRSLLSYLDLVAEIEEFLRKKGHPIVK